MTNLSTTSKAKKRKRLSSEVADVSQTASNGASTSKANGKGTSSVPQQARNDAAATATLGSKSGQQKKAQGKKKPEVVPSRGSVGRTVYVSAFGSSSSFAGSPDKAVGPLQEEGEEKGKEMSEQGWRSRAITEVKKMPKEVAKYWYNRYRLFSRFDEGVLMDAQSWFSVTPEVIAARIASRCLYPLLSEQQEQQQGGLGEAKGSEIVILDLFCGAGGNAIQFALAGMEDEGQGQGKPMTRVIAVDIDPDKIEYARHNARIYGVEERIHFLVGDAVDFVKDWKKAKAQQETPGKKKKKKAQTSQPSTSRWEGEENTKIDVVFLSPPWGGVDYQNAGMPSAVLAPSSPLLDGEDGGPGTGQLTAVGPASAPPHEASTSASLAASLPTSFSTPQLIREKEKEKEAALSAAPSGSELDPEPEAAAGADRQQYAYYPLSSLLPLSGQELYDLARCITPNVALYLPRNCDLWEIAKLTEKGMDTGTGTGTGVGRSSGGECELIAVEEQFLGSGLKALAVYCGALASGWEE